MDQEHKGFTEQDAVCILKRLPVSCGPPEQEEQDQLLQMLSYMERVGISVEEVDRLNIIHVTGTKGKGSTCAYTEQILRNSGFRTGFYSSPHLVQIRERIRINGQPIGNELFSKHFLHVYGRLDETKDSHEGAMPTFFGFFTLMAFRVFLEEKVDVAVIEVGIGGHYDCTNVVSVTNTDGLQGAAFKPSPIMVKGLADTVWPGRTQTVKHGAVTYFLDGAHTMRSMQACASWFKETSASRERTASGPVARVLLFNMSGERDSAALLKLLVPCHFDSAVFCPLITETVCTCTAYLLLKNVSEEDMMNRCLEDERIWKLHNNLGSDGGAHVLNEDRLSLVPEKKADTQVFPCILSALQWISQGRDSVLQTFLWDKHRVKAKAGPLCDAAEIHVLVTGGLYLVGGALKYPDPAYQ
uniref:folylpolyglutamate synthase, mitochondrial-like n=1 Tax=Semicossyphus pulcher TaxID=241346 RepID=UPI0037E769CB